MSEPIKALAAQASLADTRLSWRDYLELTKPRVVALMILTSVIGMLLAAPGVPGWDTLLLGNLGIALLAGAAAVVNHVVDHRIDTLMARTRKRPVATGRIGSVDALLFAAVLACLGMAILMLWINPLTAWLTLASLVGYAGVYTLFLKRATPQNIVIGGLAGAMPPLLGWTAVTGHVEGHALLLVLIIFAWTPPHFWALAIHRKEEYAKAGIPMLPVTHGNRYTELHILLYTLMLLAVSLLPFVTGMSGVLYLAGALALGLRFVLYAVRLLRGDDRRVALNTFKYSITYLMSLFVVLLVDHFVFF
ncbi:heme o synthase [Marinobacter lutaoensis]|jgi:protoheme IX farnesyltransferase|uniref:Protoheme IX farnesyltransferase n=1 Tax=Marinobacter lutaoensis TaxID=135739 RepID=A0A1V2DUR1_9GAMM|nr:heme o synthase [Marinobacter lutaoensis]MBI43959.1 protoheme IX farnesyltransferase [Oceanospirillales bacterium]NVD34286.1 protoheme IX farnesyltransferase [Marinobacter lutaoensis]ONF44433.1 protoheme IX farnesyltransferase [Marinobacter lutaoensis]|tara:strand:- start:1171 stop:2085 length:915 start_codon:yes stop_codon:yes gene_type:complete